MSNKYIEFIEHPTTTISTRPKITTQTIDVVHTKSINLDPVYEDVANETVLDTYKSDSSNIGKIYRFTGETTKYVHNALYACEEPVYSIIVIAENITPGSSNPTVIKENETVTLIFTPASGYNLPISITVTGANYTYTRASGTIILNNPTSDVIIKITPLAFPKKGNIITLDDSAYRILEITGSTAKVLGVLYPTEQSIFDSDSNVYAGSELDTYINTTWYNQLPTEMQNAILDSSITTSTYAYYSDPSTKDTPTYTYQYQYYWQDDYENLDRTATTEVIVRKVYIPDVKDIYDYFGKSCISSDELVALFLDQSTSAFDYIWLRSAKFNTNKVFLAICIAGEFYSMDVNESNYIYPMFSIDLSQVGWEFLTEGNI